jgi:putative tryptophan/tyrosine transport system substrate-binding protein
LNLGRRSLADRDSLGVSLRGLCAARSSGQQAPGRHAWPPLILFLLLLLVPWIGDGAEYKAQQVGKPPRRIGYLAPGPASCPATNVSRAFRQSLIESGFIEGQDVVVDRRCFAKDEMAGKVADDLLKTKPSVLLAAGDVAAQAMKDIRTIPVVFSNVADPVDAGLVRSLARPGTNMTGIADLTVDLYGKRAQILKEALPGVRLLATLGTSGAERFAAATDRAAATLGVQLRHVTVRRADELVDAFETMKKQGVEAVIIQQSPLFWAERRRVIDLGLKYRLPIMFPQGQPAEEGALIAYGAEQADLYRRAAVYVAKILKGAKPADLPVEQPTKFELVINLKTAKALGLTIPQSLLRRADQVIE